MLMPLPSNLTTEGAKLADVVIKISGGYPNDLDLATGIYLAAWVVDGVGRHAIRISKFTGLPRQFCVWCGINMRRGGRWHDGVINDWLTRDDGNFVFALDTLIANGHVTKIGHDFDTARFKRSGIMPLRAPS